MNIEEIRKNKPNGAQYAAMFGDHVIYFKDRNISENTLYVFSRYKEWVDAMGSLEDLNISQYDLVVIL